jgi:hypothetical protein
MAILKVLMLFGLVLGPATFTDDGYAFERGSEEQEEEEDSEELAA